MKVLRPLRYPHSYGAGIWYNPATGFYDRGYWTAGSAAE